MPGGKAAPAIQPGAMSVQGPATLSIPTTTQTITPADNQGLPANANQTGESSEQQKQGKGKGEAPATLNQSVGQSEASPIERALAIEQRSSKATQQAASASAIAQFGYGFFKAGASGFAPLTDVPVGPDYLVGPGDTLILTAWGSLEGTYPLEVNRSGELVLPRVGPVKVWGVPFGKLPEIIKGHLAKVFKDFQINVNMGKLKLMKIYVVGEVQSPGDYNITSLSTVINALSAAGGPTKNGSLRSISVRRGGKTVETVDLYDFFLKGDKSRDIRLQPGDTIFVPVIGQVAGIAGNVKRPAIYELKGEKTLRDLLALADGLLPTGYLQRIQVSRVDAHQKNMVADFSLDPKSSGKSLDDLAGSVAIQDMDVVRIFTIDTTLRGFSRLEGYVLRPGDYALKPGMRVSDLLGGDNLLPEYFSEVAELTRLFQPDMHPEKISISPARALSGDPAHNLELREFDVIKIFSRWEMEEMPKVRIAGEVQRPGEYRLFKNMTLRDLLVMAGNPKLTAYLKRADINRIKRSGESVISFPLAINLQEALNNNPQHNIPLAPFDEVFIRRIPNWAEETDRYVTLKGEFMFPGVYPIYKGEKLSAVIERAGGFTERAYLRGAKFTRLTLRELQQKRMDEILARSEQEILKKQGDLLTTSVSKDEADATRMALESLKRSVDLLKAAKAEGRLVIQLDRNLETLKKTPADVEVQGGDMLEIPAMPNAVNVFGQVYNPTSLIPVANEDVAYYLNKAGGPTRDAEEGDIYIIQADGTVLSRQQVSMFKSLVFSGFMSTRLEPGDTIVVPQRFEKTAWLRDIKDIATILGQLALTAGVIVAAGL